jgi:hypothetical protein
MSRFSTRRNDVYFATLEDETDLAGEIWSRVEDFYTRMKDRLYYRRAAESYRMFYGLSSSENPFDVTEIGVGGQTGSHSLIKVNHYYSLGEALVTMATADKPEWVAVPANEDSKTLQQKLLAQQLLDYYLREAGIEMLVRQATVSAVVMQDGYILLTWDPTAGKLVVDEVPAIPAGFDPITGEEIAEDPGAPATFEGDIRVQTLTPFDVPVNLDWRGSGERPWVITREFVDKWDLAEKFPEYREDILKASIDITTTGTMPAYWFGARLDDTGKIDQDQVAVFTLWHRKTRAVPGGKMVVVVNDKACLFNGGLPYGDKLPLHRISPATVSGTTFGHSPMINLIGVQKAISAAWSAPVTNLSLFGTGTLLVPKGSGLDVTDLGGGGLALEYDSTVPNGKPEPLNVPGLQQSAIEMAKELVRTAEVIVGAAPVIRGNASSELSGAAQLLQLQTAIQYSSGIVQGVTSILENVGTSLIKILQTFAKAPKLALIVGANKAPMLKEFTGEDIAAIDRVVVNRGNAASKTPGGKLTMADKLLDAKVITAPEYLEVANNGTLAEKLSSPATQRVLMSRENEILMQARPATEEEIQATLAGETEDVAVEVQPGLWLMNVPPVLATDNHPWHDDAHRSVLDSLAYRKNPWVIAAVGYHLGQHKGFQMDMNGGIAPIPPPGSLPPGTDPNPPPAPPVDPNANGGGPGPDGNAPPPAPSGPGPGGPGGPNMPSMPNMPQNLSGGPIPGDPGPGAA